MRWVMVLGITAGVMAGVAGTAAQSRTGASPTFTKDVAPILFNKCATCHRPGEIAPMSLLSYEDARPWAKSIRRKVVDREMPPWHADPQHGKFRNDRSLTQSEIDTIAAWVDAGAPRGSDADLPAAPRFAEGWQGGEPDFVFQMPEYKVPAEGEIDYLYFWVKNPLKEDRWIEKVELRPGTPAVVHHIRVDIVPVPDGFTVGNDGVLIDSSGKPAISREVDARVASSADASTFHLISFVPGRQLEVHRPGIGKRLVAGQWVRFNVHYQPNGVPMTDQSKLGVWFSKVPVTHELHTRTVGQSLPTEPNKTINIVEGRLIEDAVEGNAQGPSSAKRPNIPPYADNWKIVGVTPVTEPITLYAMSPHMHLRGKDMKWILTWPDGRDEVLLDVPKYDFNWQLQYELEKPIKIPAGSKLTAIAHYDNSTNNKYNPGPEKEVFWSEQSWDEMFTPYVEYTVDRMDLTRPVNTTAQP